MEHVLPLSTEGCVVFYFNVQLDEYTVSNGCYLAVKPGAVLRRRAASRGRPSRLLAQMIRSTLPVKYSCQGQEVGPSPF